MRSAATEPSPDLDLVALEVVADVLATDVRADVGGQLDPMAQPGQAERHVGRAAAHVLRAAAVGRDHDVDESLADDEGQLVGA